MGIARVSGTRRPRPSLHHTRDPRRDLVPVINLDKRSYRNFPGVFHFLSPYISFGLFLYKKKATSSMLKIRDESDTMTYPSPKRRRISQAYNSDYLSFLSDEILLHILSYLPMPALLICQRYACSRDPS